RLARSTMGALRLTLVLYSWTIRYFEQNVCMAGLIQRTPAREILACEESPDAAAVDVDVIVVAAPAFKDAVAVRHPVGVVCGRRVPIDALPECLDAIGHRETRPEM